MFIDPDSLAMMRAMAEDSDNRIWEFFERQSPEDLAILRALFIHAGQTNGAGAQYITGKIDSIFHFKHREHCTNCGQIACGHLEELRASMEAEGTLPQGDETSTDPEPLTVGDLERQASMAAYKVKDSGQGDGSVVCIECGHQYVSLEDRMLRTDCHGCKHKAAWG